MKKLVLFLFAIFATTSHSMELRQFKKSLSVMVHRGLISKEEAQKHLAEYQFQLENNDSKISKSLLKRVPASTTETKEF